MLVRAGGFTFLTDPNFLHAGQSAYLGLGLRSKRRTDPAMQIADLPPLDFVVLSHHHGDHFDEVATRELAKDLPIVTEPHAAGVLRQAGFREVRALRTWEAQRFSRGDAEVVVTAAPAQHAPRPLGWLLPDVMGSVLEFRSGGRPTYRLYITGDTLLHDGLAEIARRHPDLDLGLFHLGGTRVAGVLLTMDAAQGVEAVRIIAPRTAVPIHYDDYPVFKSPLEDFQRAVAGAGLPTEVRYLGRGETYGFRLPASPSGD